MSKDNYWEDYWKKEGKQGQVFINKNGEKPAYLSKLWKDYFKKFKSDITIIDIACGGGSVFLDLPKPNNYKLYGADISEQALKHAKQHIKSLNTLQCSTSNISLPDSFVDNVVSQFGIEYSGVSGFIEAIRILKSNGSFHFLVHCENGYIDKQNRGKLDGALLVKESDFINIAKKLTNALYKDDKEAIHNIHSDFSIVEPKLLAYNNSFPTGVHSHLYFGFKKLLLNMNSYQCEDITEWLDSIKNEVEESIIRLQQMRDAALSELNIKELEVILKDAGVTKFNFEAFYVDNQKDPIGWLIHGVK